MPLLTIEELTDIPLFGWREQLRADLQREDQAQVLADSEWIARQDDGDACIMGTGVVA